MSNPLCHAGRMKIKKSVWLSGSRLNFFGPSLQNIATFGGARLVKNSDARHELIGGTAGDHADAREWCSLFAPEIVFSDCRETRTSHLRRNVKRIKLFPLNANPLGHVNRN